MAKQDELGALWIKSGQCGEYLTGKINGVAVVAFRNDKKKNPKEPDWRILKSKQQGEQTQPSARPYQQAAGVDESDPFA